jgi:hypothetical protein
MLLSFHASSQKKKQDPDPHITTPLSSGISLCVHDSTIKPIEDNSSAVVDVTTLASLNDAHIDKEHKHETIY